MFQHRFTDTGLCHRGSSTAIELLIREPLKCCSGNVLTFYLEDCIKPGLCSDRIMFEWWDMEGIFWDILHNSTMWGWHTNRNNAMQHNRMISEGSSSALHHMNKWHFKYIKIENSYNLIGWVMKHAVHFAVCLVIVWDPFVVSICIRKSHGS